MLQTAPVESEWLLVLYDLLRRIDPYVARMPSSDPQQVLARWRGLKLKDRSGNDDKHDEGLFTSLSLVDEFRCMIAALYGKQYEDKTIKQLGGPDDPDVVLRCAFYGNGHLTRDRMKAAYKRDERTFVFAALFNDSFYQKQDCRVEIEEHLSDPLSYMYKARCAQIHTRYPPFDPRPVSDTVTQEKPPTDEMAALSRIGDQIAAVQAQIGRMSSISILGFIALLAILLYTQY